MIPSVNLKNIPLNVGERYEVINLIIYFIFKEFISRLKPILVQELMAML